MACAIFDDSYSFQGVADMWSIDLQPQVFIQPRQIVWRTAFIGHPLVLCLNLTENARAHFIRGFNQSCPAEHDLNQYVYIFGISVIDRERCL